VTVAATSEGHLQALKWAAQWDERRWAIEDCRHLSRRLEADLLAAGEMVVRVPPKMMAGDPSFGSDSRQVRSDRCVGGGPGGAAGTRPAGRSSGWAVPGDPKLLVDYRERLVRERTSLQNSLRWRIHELDPTFDPPARSLDRYVMLDQIETFLLGYQGLVAELAGREVSRIRELTREANQLEGDIRARIKRVAPSLLELAGCAALTAAKLVGEAADIRRFTSRDAYAAWNGTAPIPVWSGNQTRFRLSRGGNRQTNAAIHRIAITQIRCHPDAQAFIDRRLAAGDTKREALRALKRRLSDVVYRTMLQDTRHHPQAAPARAA
jgi:transposase